MSVLRAVAAVCSLSLWFAFPALAADPATPLPPGFRGDLLKVLSNVEQQTVSLEQAMPQAKFGWRPAKDVRSVAEVYLHAAGSVYFFMGQLGREAPADVKALVAAKKWESQTTNKDEIKTILTNAFAFLRKAALEANDADLDKTLQFFGTEFTQRGIYMLTFGHLQEHLGQSIAYARVNGVVPPWSKAEKK
jgi:uncharacterized damage-inducible protein DinB